MATHITLTRLDDDAEAIVEAFAERTGLTPEDEGDRWIFDVTGEGHEIEVVQTLDGIDEGWPAHVGVRAPD